ncbi:MAG: hypothetical protein QM767_22755 [Anaeromyxobacter sp.]
MTRTTTTEKGAVLIPSDAPLYVLTRLADARRASSHLRGGDRATR